MAKGNNDNVNRLITGVIGVLLTFAGYLGNRTLVRIEEAQESSDLRQRAILEEISTFKLTDRWTRTDHYKYAENIQRDLSHLDKRVTKCCKD